MGLVARREVTGIENIPRSGACLVVFNQTSVFDTPIVNTLVPRADVTGLVALDYRRNPFYRVLIEAGGGMWIRRSSSDRAALQAALRALERGWVVEISPEGRRSPTGALVRAKPGAAFLATRTGAPVVPVAFTNTENLAASLRRLRRSTITVRVGEPFQLDPIDGGNRHLRLLDATDQVMCRVAALLPPRYRGVYAGHPYLASLEGERA
jgi:1-acyl-sn-glycerol-3-phosphate acyltransferase